MAGGGYYWAGMVIQSVFTAWFSTWTVLILLTWSGLYDGQIAGQVNLANFVDLTPTAFLISFILLDLLILAAWWVTLRRRRWAYIAYFVVILLDIAEWAAFALLPHYDNSQEPYVIGMSLIGVWCLRRWAGLNSLASPAGNG
ncbi:hypothetical protein RMQ97_10760 [Maricaulis sp. D1M11]